MVSGVISGGQSSTPGLLETDTTTGGLELGGSLVPVLEKRHAIGLRTTMSLTTWFLCWIFLILLLSAGRLEVFNGGGHEVTCSQGLSDCTLRDVNPLSLLSSRVVDIVNLTTRFELCCEDRAPCTLCMAMDIEVKISLEDEESSDEQLEHSEDAKVTSVKVCYIAANAIPVCKKVEFIVNPSALTQQEAKISIMVKQPVGVTFSSHVMVYSFKNPRVCRKVVVPSLDEVCSHEMGGRLEECDVPELRAVINIETNQVDLQFAGGDRSLPFICMKSEINGRCQRWNNTSVPLHSVTPCTCFKAWHKDDKAQRHSQSCPFKDVDFHIRRNVWQNVSVSLSRGHLNDGLPVLWWTVSAPCRLEGEVWPCSPLRGCRVQQGFPQPLRNDNWRQNKKDHWETTGVFENLNFQLLPPCLMVKVRGRDSMLGPYCLAAAGRWRWGLLVAGVMLLLLLSLTLLTSYLLSFVKKWAWSWQHGRFIKISGRGPVLLLSPPDVNEGVSESVRDLGSLLHRQGFGVTLDSWSRRKQCDLGPAPWLHAQMTELKKRGGRALLVLTHPGLQRAQEWVLKMKEEDGGHPHSAVFTTSLFLIDTDRQLGRAGERFVLVTFDSDLCRKSELPELLLGLRLFQLPSQTKALLAELTVGERARAPPPERPRTSGEDPKCAFDSSVRTC